MITGQPIRDEAALILCPENRADGIVLLDQLIATISHKISALDLCSKFVLLTLIFTAGIGAVWLYLTDHTPKSQMLPWALCILSVVGIAVQFTFWYKIQHNELGRKLTMSHRDIVPSALNDLIAAYATEAKRAYTHTGIVNNELFASHWAILLFSKDAEIRGWVRSIKGRRQSKEIYTARYRAQEPLSDQFQSANSEAEKPIEPEDSSAAHKYLLGDDCANLNENPEHQWLVGGSRTEYVISRDQALAIDPPLVQEWKSFVLDGARYELRRGGQARSPSIARRAIQKELKMYFGDDLSPNQKPSKSLIRRMLSVGKTNAKLRSHFSR